VIVGALGLEIDSISVPAPEVGHWIAAVAAASLDFQATIAISVKKNKKKTELVLTILGFCV